MSILISGPSFLVSMSSMGRMVALRSRITCSPRGNGMITAGCL